MMRKEGSTTPKVAAKEPQKPATRLPIKVAELMAMGPGVDSAMAMTSKRMSSEIHFFFSMTSFSISGIMA